MYGRLLSCLGLLTSSDEPIKKTPDEIIGGHEGGTEGQVRAMMESAKGHVLIIDEAYQLAASQYVTACVYVAVLRSLFVTQIWSNCVRHHRCEDRWLCWGEHVRPLASHQSA